MNNYSHSLRSFVKDTKSYNKKKAPNRHFSPPVKFIFTLSLLFIFTIFSITSSSADVISINSGGSEQIVVNPDTYIEGFFTGKLFICGDGVIDTEIGEQCDDGNTNSGDGCSSTCQTEAVTPPGGGGGGGGGAAPSLSVLPTEFTLTLEINTNAPRTITVTNNGASTASVTLSYSMFDSEQNPVSMILMNTTSFSLQAGQSAQIPVTFVAGSETGIFTGSIRVGSITIPVTINVRTQLLLFDSNIIVLNRDYLVVKGDDLRTRVTLIPLGDEERLDVTLDYTIRDYSGRIYLTQRETLLIQDRINFDRNFGTGSLPIGRYVVGLELRYPNGVAPSSAHFEVVTRAPITFGTIVLWLIMLIIILGIIIIIIIIYKRKKKEEETNSP